MGAQALLGINFDLQSYFKEQVPDESTSFRIFAYLAEEGIWCPALDELVKDAHAGKVVYHVCRDSTMVAAREKAVPKKDKKAGKAKRKRGNSSKNAVKTLKEPTELEKQAREDPNASLKKLNKNCA